MVFTLAARDGPAAFAPHAERSTLNETFPVAWCYGWNPACRWPMPAPLSRAHAWNRNDAINIILIGAGITVPGDAHLASASSLAAATPPASKSGSHQSPPRRAIRESARIRYAAKSFRCRTGFCCRWVNRWHPVVTGQSRCDPASRPSLWTLGRNYSRC